MSASSTDRDVIFEFRRIGAYVKVSAVDAMTGLEISIVGAAGSSDAILKRTAYNKLLYVLRKQGRISS